MKNLPQTFLKQTPIVVLGVLAAHASGQSTQIVGSFKGYFNGQSPFLYADFNHSGPTTYADAFTYFNAPGGENPFNFSSTVTCAADGGGDHVGAFMRADRAYGSYPSSTLSDSFVASGSADVTFDDFQVTGMGTLPVSTRMFTHLDGSLSAGAALYTSGKPGEATASSTALVSVYANGSSVGIGALSTSQATGSDPVTSGSGMLQNFAGSGTLVSDPFKVTPNVPFSVTLSLGVSAGAELIDEAGGSMVSSGDFSNTFTFPIGVPIFDLPPGYTVNSPSAHIVNNYYVNPVPEPGSLAVLGLGALGLVGRRARRKG